MIGRVYCTISDALIILIRLITFDGLSNAVEIWGLMLLSRLILIHLDLLWFS